MVDIWKETDNALKRGNVPIEMVLEITRRCNLDCCHCYSVRDGAELDFAQIEEIAGQLRDAGCLFVTLTGGEPTVRDDFVEVVSLLRGRGFDVKVLTNGTGITDDTADALKECAPGAIGISIHGACAETHDGVTRVAGSFERSIAAVRALKERGMTAYVKCTLMKRNVGERRDVERLASKLGVTCMIDPIVSPKDDGSREVLAHRLPDDVLRGIFGERFDELEEAAADGDPLFCEAGRTFGAISATGEVYPCVQLPLSVGNVFETPLAAIWREAPLLVRMREACREDLAVCRECPQAASCHRCPGLAYLEEGDVFGPSPTACFIAAEYARHREAAKSRDSHHFRVANSAEANRCG